MQLLLILALLFMVNTNGKGCQASESEEQAQSQKRQKLMHHCEEMPETEYWNTLPPELWCQIFDELTFQELKKAKNLCRRWQLLGDDPFFSLPTQVCLKPLAIVLRKLEGIESKDCQKYYQELFSLPLVHSKLLAEPVVLGNILSTISIVPFLFKSQLTAYDLYISLGQGNLLPHQQETLKAYTKNAEVFPDGESLFSQEFVEFAKSQAAYYKALYLMTLFNCTDTESITGLFQRLDQATSAENINQDKSEQEAVLLAQAMMYLGSFSSDIAYSLGKYFSRWAKNSKVSLPRDEWLKWAELFYRESASQGDDEAAFKVTVILDNRGEYDQAKQILITLAERGCAKAQWSLALRYELEGKLKEAETYYAQAAAQEEDGEAQYYLAEFLKSQGRFEEAEPYYQKAANYGMNEAYNKLGLCQERKNDLESAYRSYEKGRLKEHPFASLNLANLLEQHPEIFPGSSYERNNLISNLREQNKKHIEKWKEWGR